MKKSLSKSAGKDSNLPPKATPPVPADIIQSDEVVRVLEHVSSPYRWELLEIPKTQANISVPKKTSLQK